MQYSISINQTKALEWGLNAQQALLFAFVYECPSLCPEVIHNGIQYYALSKFMILDKMPLLTDKPDTAYRMLKALRDKELIELACVNNTNLVRIMDKAGEWEHKNLEQFVTAERDAIASFKNYLEQNAEILKPVATWGDGECGHLHELLKAALLDAEVKEKPARSYRKKEIGAELRTAVFERDAYRCVHCGSHKSLCADHIYPEVLGGEATMENLQTLCRSCNSKKGCSVEVKR